MPILNWFSDLLLELRIRRAARRLVRTRHSRDVERLIALVASRSTAQVLRMERRMGLVSNGQRVATRAGAIQARSGTPTPIRPA